MALNALPPWIRQWATSFSNLVGRYVPRISKVVGTSTHLPPVATPLWTIIIHAAL